MQLDLFGSARVVAWQEGKAAFLFAGEGCWSELPHLYARYGTTATARADRPAEGARSTPAPRSSATRACRRPRWSSTRCMAPGGHAVLMRQVYNKTRTYLRVAGRPRSAARSRSSTTAITRRWRRRSVPRRGSSSPRPSPIRWCARRISTRSARSSPRRATAAPALQAGRRLDDRRRRGRSRAPLLDQGVDVVVGQRHQGARRPRPRPLGLRRHPRHGPGQRGDGSDGDARRHPRLAPRRGHRWPASTTPSAGARDAARRRRPASPRSSPRIPRVSEVFHPSLPTHPDAAAIARAVRPRHGSLLSFRVAGADEARTRHVADVLATCDDRPLRAVVRRPGHEGQPPPDGVGVLHAGGRAAPQRLRSADPPGRGRRGCRRPHRRRSTGRSITPAPSRRPTSRRGNTIGRPRSGSRRRFRRAPPSGRRGSPRSSRARAQSGLLRRCPGARGCRSAGESSAPRGHPRPSSSAAP